MRLKALLCCMVLVSAPRLAGAATAPEYGPWGFDLAGQDRSARPGDDFYAYANGTAVKQLVIPADQSSYGSFNKLRDLAEERTHAILEAAAAKATALPTDPLGKAGTFYKTFMDADAVEKRGISPLKPDQVMIQAVATQADFARLCGLAPKTMLGSLFGVDITPDAKDPTKYAIYVGQAGLGLPDRDYYLAASFADKRAKYPAFVEKLLTLSGWPDAKTAAAKVVAFETKLAGAQWSRADRRDDDKTYNPLTLDALVATAPGFDWRAFFTAADLGAPAQIILTENSAIVKMAAITGATPIETLRAWAAFHLALDASPLLGKDFVDTNFEFLGKTLQGQLQERPRWKRAVHATEAALGEAVGQAYAAQYFPPDARAQMEVLTHGLRDAFARHLEHNDWMTAATRQKALAKLATFDFQVGYPKRWRDYSGLTIREGDLYGNVERSDAFEWAFWVSHLGHPVDRDLWQMLPETVNAYNDPQLNEVVFPAAILQPPFFNPTADAAINYGAIGGVIGHEMTHSFDDQGRKHDAQGRLTDWWTPADVKQFEAKAQKFGAQYARMNILPGAHINPALTMGENIADLGGLTLALDAYHASLQGKPAPVIDGLTGDQRVFLGWAQVWRMKIRDEAARQRLTVDPHSPAPARVIGPMQNIDAWYTAFGIKPGDKEYLAPKDRVKIW